MKHLTLQKNHGWCGIYNLANVLRDSDILKYIDNDTYKLSSFEHMNVILEELKYNMELMPIINLTANHDPIPGWLSVDLITHKHYYSDGNMPSKIEIPIMPFIITIKSDLTGFHSVSIIRHYNQYIYSDPMNKEYIILDESDLLKYCENVYSVSIFSRKDNGLSDALFLEGKQMGFDKLFK